MIAQHSTKLCLGGESGGNYPQEEGTPPELHPAPGSTGTVRLGLFLPKAEVGFGWYFIIPGAATERGEDASDSDRDRPDLG